MEVEKTKQKMSTSGPNTVHHSQWEEENQCDELSAVDECDNESCCETFCCCC